MLRKVLGGIAAALFGFALVASLEAAPVAPHVHNQGAFQEAVQASTCYVYSTSVVPQDEQASHIYLSRAGDYKKHPAIVHNLGYHRGFLDASASLNLQFNLEQKTKELRTWAEMRSLLAEGYLIANGCEAKLVAVIDE